MIQSRFRCCASLSAVVCALMATSPLSADEYSAQWGLGMIGAKAAHDRGYTGKGVNVGVVDSGIFGDHPDLIDRMSGLSVNGYTGGPAEADAEGHGTHVGGIIAASHNGVGMMGVAPDALLTPLQLADDDGDISDDTIDQMVGTVYAYGLANGIEFYNNSWGSDEMMPQDGPDLDRVRAEVEAEMPLSLAAFRNAANQGAVLVWAAGNDGYPGVSVEAGLPHLYPELRSSWLAVAALGSDGQLTDYTNRCGSVAMGWCLSAPGGDDDEDAGGIYSTANDGGYVRMSGTSMAAPHVTGALAVARDMFPNARASDLGRLLLATSTDLGAAGIDAEYGWGLLNLDNLTRTRNAAGGALFAQSALARSQTIDQILALVENRAAGLGEPTMGPAGATVSTHGSAPQSAEDSRVWAQPLAGVGLVSASANGAAGTTRVGGVLGGVELIATDTARFGLAAGLSQSTLHSAGSRARFTGLHAVAYGGIQTTEGFFADGTLGLSRFETSQSRTNISGTSGTVLGSGLTGSSKTTDIGLWTSARIGKAFETAALIAKPYLHGRLVHQWGGSAFESGADVFGLSLAAGTGTQSELGVGLRLAALPVRFGTVDVAPSLDLAYARALGSDTWSRKVTLLGAPVTARTSALGRDIGRLTAGVIVSSASGNLAGRLAYAGEIRGNAQAHSLNAGLSLRF